MAKAKLMISESHDQATEGRREVEALIKEMQFKEAAKFYGELAEIIHAANRNFISHTDVATRIGPVAYEAARTANTEFTRVLRLRKKSVAGKKSHEERA